MKYNDEQSIIDLTESFFQETRIIDLPVNTDRAVIPAPRTIGQIIDDEINYLVSIGTVRLRSELRAELENVKDELENVRDELAAIHNERERTSVQRAVLERECREVKRARELLATEMAETRQARQQITGLYDRLCVAAGLCTPARSAALTGAQPLPIQIQLQIVTQPPEQQPAPHPNRRPRRTASDANRQFEFRPLERTWVIREDRR